MSDKRMNIKKFNNDVKYIDPELEAEAHIATELGLPAPTKLAIDIIREKKLAAEAEACRIRKQSTGSKTSKAQRKVCNRGISGTKTRKDSFKLKYEVEDTDDVYDNVDDTLVDEEDFIQHDSIINNTSHITGAIRDYFRNGNVEEAIVSIDNYAVTRDDIYLALKEIIVGLLDAGVTKIKAASTLICALITAKKASTSNVLDMLNEMLVQLDHLLVDFPTASNTLQQLFARLVYDRLLTVDDLEDIKLCVSDAKNVKVEQICYSAIGYCKDHETLRNMFEPDGCDEPLAALDEHFVNIINGYFDTYDSDDAMRRLKLIGVPHYHHAFVYQTLLYAVKTGSEKKGDIATGLLKKMLNCGFLTLTSIETGFEQFINKLDDLKLDIPNIFTFTNHIVDSALTSGVLVTKKISSCSSEVDKYHPLLVEARLRDRLEDEGVGSLSSNSSGDEEVIPHFIA